MRIHELKPAAGSIKKNKRVGRGQGSGRGGTSTRGHKGAKSRSGYTHNAGFEGGQMPLQRRVPKFGFKNPNRKVYKPINLSDLEKLAKDKKLKNIDQDQLYKNGLIGKHDLIKILAKGELTVTVNVTAHAFSASAKSAIEAAGGSVTTL